jgi:hypothetical protein
MILEYCQSNFGIELKGTINEILAHNEYYVYVAIHAISDAILNEHEVAKKLEVIRKYIKTEGLFNVFSIFHEARHMRSFRLIRPIIKVFNEKTTALFSLLMQQIDTNIQSDFWVKFNVLNKELLDYLSVSFALEELRATILALNDMPSESQQLIITKVYPMKQDDPETKIFHELHGITGGHWSVMFYLTILAEFLSPDNPLEELVRLQSILNKEKPFKWTDEQWSDWLNSWNELKNGVEFEESFPAPDKLITGLSNNKTTMLYANNPIELFLESMRQQLANPELIRSLICPFKETCNSCCGFGNNLRGIWAGIPNEFSDNLEPPATVCMNYTKI